MMNNKILIFLGFLFMGCKGISQDKQYAYSEVEKRLGVIKAFVDGKEVDSTLKRAEAVAFIEKLTKIESESHFIAESKLNPTQGDYDKWNKWYELNKPKLYWDERNRKVSKFAPLMISVFFYSEKDKQELNHNYISLEYSYDHTEIPIPKVIFYRDTFVSDEISFVGYRFKVSESELALLENVISKKSSYLIIDSLADRYYDFIVVKNGSKEIYGTSTLKKSKELFSEILEHLKKRKDFTEMENAFRYLNGQLRPRGG